MRDQSAHQWDAAVLAISVLVCGISALAVLYASPAQYAEFVARERVDLNMMRAPGWPDPAYGGGIEGVWYTQATIVDLHRETFAYVLGVGSRLPLSPTRGDFYSPDERAYLDRLREVFVAASVGVLVLTLAVVVLTFWAKWRGRLGRLVRAGALSAAVAVALMSTTALILDPGAVGQWLHQILVPERPAMVVVVGNLAALYPTTFINEVALRSALSSIAIALVIAAIAHITVVGVHGRSSTITSLQPPRLVSD